MKFAFALLALAVAVQGRSTGLDAPITAVSTADSPWVVHLRFATTFGAGLLNTCVGSLISDRWVLTSSACVQDLRFAWIRYGAANVLNPELVTETATTRSNNRLGLISINRVVESTATISPVELAETDELPETGTLCGYGAQEDGSPGETLSCYEFQLSAQEGELFEGTSEEGQATEFDIGAPLVSNGKQVGVLVRPAENGSNALFASVGAYKSWIDFETGASF